MRDRSNLRGYQVAHADFLKSGDGALALVEMGLGKTAATLTAMSDIIEEDYRELGLLRRFLVVGPRRVATYTWPEEIQQWRHLRHLRIAVAVGSAVKRLRAVTDPRAHIVTINYENLSWLMEKFPKGTLPFYGVVFDEVDKMKSPSTQRFKDLRYRAHEFTWRVGMTGTIAPESLLNVWGPAYLVTSKPAVKEAKGGRPPMTAILGSSYETFTNEYFADEDYFGHKKAPRPGSVQAVGAKLAPITFQALAKDHLDLPELVVQDHKYDLEPKVMEQYRQFEKDFVLALDRGDALNDEDEWFDDEQAEASNAAVLKNKLRQICSGFVYTQKPGEARKTIWLHNQKVSAYEDMVSELMGAAHLAVYGYQAEVAKLKLDARLGGGISDKREREILAEWDAGKLACLGMHPASAGHGLNLHKGGAHHIAFLTLPWSRGLYDQTIARLRRMGQKNTVILHRFIARGTVEEAVVEALNSKGAVQEAVIAALKRKAAA